MKFAVLLSLALLSGCSLVQWLPTSACERVNYQRDLNKVVVHAECTV